MRATSRPPSSWVGSACHELEPSALISMPPPAIPDTLSATATDTRVGSAAARASKAQRRGARGPSAAAPAARRKRRCGCRRRPRAPPAASHSPGSGTFRSASRAIPAPGWLPVVHWLVPARQRRQCAAAIGARSPSSGLTHDTANELVAPPALAALERQRRGRRGAVVYPHRHRAGHVGVVGRVDRPHLQAAACPPRALAVSTVTWPGLVAAGDGAGEVARP